MGQSSQGILGKPGTSNMLLLAILLLGVGIQAAPQGGFLRKLQSSSSSGAASSSSTLDSKVETNGGKWVWSEVSQKYEWEAEAGTKQNYESSYQPKCSYQPKEECTTVYENVERKVMDVECHTEYKKECHTEYKQECHTEYTTECHKVPTTRKVKQTEVKCTKDYYGKETRKDHDIIVTVRDTEEKCEKKPHEKCEEVPHPVCEKKPREVCVDVVTMKTEKVPRQHCKTVQKKVCY